MNARSTLVRLATTALLSAPLALAGAATARADGPAPTAETCEYRGLLTSLQRLAVVAAGTDKRETPPVGLDVGRDRVTLFDAASREPLLVATCDGAAIPAATPLRKRGDRGVGTVRQAGRTVSVTSQGAVSLDFDAGTLFPRSFHILTFDDGSVSVSFGADAAGEGKGVLLYQASTNGAGDFVEKQDASVGCGCERWVTATGESGERPFVPKR